MDTKESMDWMERMGKLEELANDMRIELKLREMANGVRGELDKSFGFRYASADVKSHIDDVALLTGKKAFYDTVMLRRYSDAQKEKEAEYLEKWNAATCIYMGDVPDAHADYAVFVRGMKDITPMLLGQAIAQGEYITEHTKRIGSLEGFQKEFANDCVELVGSLGFNLIGKNRVPVDEDDEVHVDTDRFDIGYGPQLRGCDYAGRLVHSRKEVPYPEIFHAENEHEMWLIVKKITGP